MWSSIRRHIFIFGLLAETTNFMVQRPRILWFMKFRIFRLFPIGVAFVGCGLLRYCSRFAKKVCKLRLQRANVLNLISRAMLLGVVFFVNHHLALYFMLKIQNFQKWYTYLCWMILMPDSKLSDFVAVWILST